MRLPKTHVEVDDGAPVTAWGGLALLITFIQSLKVVQRLNEKLSLIKQPKPYTNADHVLALVFNLYIGGRHLEDIAALQHSPALQRMVGAERLPDPTTAGDFLRRFDEPDEHNLTALRSVGDGLQEEVWKKLTRKWNQRLRQRRLRQGRGRTLTQKKLPLATVDLDGHIEAELGVTKTGADFSFNGSWGFQPLVLTLAQSSEILWVRNRPANGRSSEDAAAALDQVLPRLQPYFGRILVRGDSDFDRADIRATCVKHGAAFAFVGRDQRQARTKLALALPESEWRPYLSKAERRRRHSRRGERKQKPNRRRQRARERGYKELHQAGEWMSEQLYHSPTDEATHRLVFRRQLVEHRQGQIHLFDEYRYWSIVTNLPREMTTAEVIDETYQRCDQENIIEQLGTGVAAWNMPVAEFLGNCAWLEMARLAWNLGKWIALLSLPDEVVRWEWKRFRQAFVQIVAQVVRKGREVITRISTSHRYWSTFIEALNLLRL